MSWKDWRSGNPPPGSWLCVSLRISCGVWKKIPWRAVKLMKFVFLLTCALHPFFYPYSPLLKKTPNKTQPKKKAIKQQNPLNLQPSPVFMVQEETEAMKLGGTRGSRYSWLVCVCLCTDWLIDHGGALLWPLAHWDTALSCSFCSPHSCSFSWQHCPFGSNVVLGGWEERQHNHNPLSH